jgi:hypothetical protein
MRKAPHRKGFEDDAEEETKKGPRTKERGGRTDGGTNSERRDNIDRVGGFQEKPNGWKTVY